MPDAARELAEAGAAYAERSEEGERPNPAVHGDAQEGSNLPRGGSRGRVLRARTWLRSRTLPPRPAQAASEEPEEN